MIHHNLLDPEHTSEGGVSTFATFWSWQGAEGSRNVWGALLYVRHIKGLALGTDTTIKDIAQGLTPGDRICAESGRVAETGSWCRSLFRQQIMG